MGTTLNDIKDTLVEGDYVICLKASFEDLTVGAVYEVKGSGYSKSIVDDFDSERRLTQINVSEFKRLPKTGDTVVRGPSWKWREQDGGEGKTGVVIDDRHYAHTDATAEDQGNFWITVKWSEGGHNGYRVGTTLDDVQVLKHPRVALKEEPKYSPGWTVGDEVVCKDAEDTRRLTYGKSYKVLGVGPAFTRISDNTGLEGGWFHNRFVKSEDWVPVEVEKTIEQEVEDMDILTTSSSGLQSILEERHGSHGDFSENAYIKQGMWSYIEKSSQFDHLNDVQKEALQMIVHKIARAVSGNPDHKDHWDDMAGYATLVSERL